MSELHYEIKRTVNKKVVTREKNAPQPFLSLNWRKQTEKCRP